MYYIKRLPDRDKPVHIHIKVKRHVVLKNIDGWLHETVLSIRQTEDLFNAKFRMEKNEDKSKTRIFI